jgi:hypothetical protein
MTLFSLRRGISRLALALPLACVSAFAGTINVHWIADPSSTRNWSTAANWSGGVVPNNGGGNSYRVTIASSFTPPTVFDISPTIGSLVNDGVLLGDTSQTLTTDSLYNSGSINLGISPQTLPAPNGSLNVSGNANNTGVIQLENLGSLTVGDTLTNTGDVNVGPRSPAQLRAQYYIQTGGTNPTFGSVTGISSGSTMSVADAVISGGLFALIDGTINGDLSMKGGTFYTLADSCSCPSILNGDFSASSSSTYFPEVHTGATSSHLAISGDASIAGTLSLFFDYGKFGDGTTINLMSYAAETGQFNSIEWTGLFPNQTVSLNYGPHQLDAVVHGRPLPEPTSWLLMGTGIVALLLFSGRVPPSAADSTETVVLEQKS